MKTLFTIILILGSLGLKAQTKTNTIAGFPDSAITATTVLNGYPLFSSTGHKPYYGWFEFRCPNLHWGVDTVKGHYVIHVKRSQTRWLNDTTMLIGNFKTPKKHKLIKHELFKI
jgi:hypothetical protein